MKTNYRLISDLRPDITDKWQVHVMVSRTWTVYNPYTDRIYSLDLILANDNKDIFVQFLYDMKISPSYLPVNMFQHYAFDFIPFQILASRVGDDRYLTGLFVSGLQLNKYKLVTRLKENQEEMTCVLFNEYATALICMTLDQFLEKSFLEMSLLLIMDRPGRDISEALCESQNEAL
ncbi:hypothetical protein L2E82_10514 [Cichorium intybus]|uniref:Uncharacterized protein n=1 Tax=Cichorium intybus TaxID=13427 RepID=A0ACB9GAN9_CICIN|nr:hypothetical protein L2E82_10514 [Cichorium intybus]